MTTFIKNILLNSLIIIFIFLLLGCSNNHRLNDTNKLSNSKTELNDPNKRGLLEEIFGNIDIITDIVEPIGPGMARHEAKRVITVWNKKWSFEQKMITKQVAMVFGKALEKTGKEQILIAELEIIEIEVKIELLKDREEKEQKMAEEQLRLLKKMLLEKQIALKAKQIIIESAVAFLDEVSTGLN